MIGFSFEAFTFSMDVTFFRTHAPHINPFQHRQSYISISLLAKVYYPGHRCRCTHTGSTICLHIGPAAPSLLPKWVTMSFKLILSSSPRCHYTSKRLCGQNMTLITYTYLFQTYCAWLSAFCMPLFFPPSTHPLHVPLHTFNSLQYIFLLPFLFALVALNIPLRFDTTAGHVLRPCFQRQLTFYNFEFRNRSTTCGQLF